MKINNRVKLANIYLRSVLHFSKKPYGLNHADAEIDERLMRTIEDHAGITEEDAVEWRKTLFNDYCQRRLDQMYNRLGKAFDHLLESYEADEWLNKYDNVVPIMMDVIVIPR